MGGGNWSTSAYKASETLRAASGTSAFHYSDTAKATGRIVVHEDLDPKKVAGATSPNAGKPIREAFDTDEHPNSTPIAVIFDETGSMGSLPGILRDKLPQLHGLLQRRGYVEHPQILFGAVGDAYSDRAPLQIGQFESDNAMAGDLSKILLEGLGGGGNHESYELAIYYMARHTELDSVTKRGKKGYLFIVGDECVYPRVNRRQVEALIGDKLEEDISTEDIIREAQKKFEVFFLFATQGLHSTSEVIRGGAKRSDALYWGDLLGQNAIVLDDASAVCETIALTLGLMEGVVDLDEGAEHLLEISDKSTVASVSRALATVGASAGGVAKSDGSLPISGGTSGVTRL